MNRIAAALLLALISLSIGVPAMSQGTPVVGSPQPASADPPIARPPTVPVRIPLFTGDRFDSFDAHPFHFIPPSRRGPWAKILLVADFRCTKGVQYDRTCTVFLGDVNIFFGTTAEPGRQTAPVWRVERDLTDYSPLFARPQTGSVNLGNIVNKSLTGVLYGSAWLLFYPAGQGAPSARPADIVLPMNGKNSALSLPGAKTPLSTTVTFPRNVVRAYLDIILQGQAGDEFWYLSVPDQDAGELQSSGGTGFREGEVSIDGLSAGVVPIYPWIYTGGIDPLWWRPIPGIQTLNLAPYRVNLTPFAGLLDDGRPHTISVKVVNDRGSFTAAGALLVYTDPHAKSVTGKLTLDTLAAPAPMVRTSLHKSTLDEIGGLVNVKSHRQFAIEGWVNTSRGRIDTFIEEMVDFRNRQSYSITPAAQGIDLTQSQTMYIATTTRAPGSVTMMASLTRWPLSMHLSFPSDHIAGARQVDAVTQGIGRREMDSVGHAITLSSSLDDRLTASDSIVFAGKGRRAKVSPRSSQTFIYSDSQGGRWSRTVRSADLKVTRVTSPPTSSSLGKGAIHTALNSRSRRLR